MVKKEQRSFTKSRTHFLNQLIEDQLEERKAIETNFLKSFRKNVNPKKPIFTIHRTENKEFVRFFSKKDKDNSQHNFINSEIYA
ncbi:hypothetical protein Fleli_1571 [Bernardetia litoralis DSM 6794]|uniref:Uncharacterized protein n=1 Tax=Bernardetia litoralis (strain ATCC 23117 / DSM 6794 / NBRC 15988 / NCIMB 1366 / Fx l1 / Sio-4) TaxID=880071 RepID=I4AJ55_BERLS|nr:hypothetical protein [Bernardetia litoralis]AFM03990.1 hypothetical protein Fleli_1571 [Bernardetia litoralis DSM 6794]